MKHKGPPVVCSVGSIDPTAAAGLAMDLRVYALLQVAGFVAVGALTAQNSRRVRQVVALPPSLLVEQLEAIWEQVRPDAICIGLLPDAAGIRALRKFLTALRLRPPIVIDPVIGSSSGHTFLRSHALLELKKLFSLATIITPNAVEAARFASVRVATAVDAETAARKLSACGCAVLVTGGHLRGSSCVDVLAHCGRVRRYAASRLAGSMRGAGGILAAALAVSLARGETLESAVAAARRFLRSAHRSATPLGTGSRQFIALDS